tara:strand:+ start:661 stop:1206 length:546 start_codon:yes stop_codon:yes gene_type:complete
MNRIKELSKEEWGRDYVFDYIISLFGNKPTKIGEVGCARDPNGRAGDGWSTFFWAKYLNKCGGELHCCDINQEALDFVKSSIPENNFKMNLHLMDGVKFLQENKPFDFVYLDGGNDPNQTKEQFITIKDETDIILVDDWSVKGFVFEEDKFEKILFDIGENHMGLISTTEHIGKLTEKLNK